MRVARSTDEAAAAVRDGAVALAGRTVLRPGLPTPEQAVDLSRIPGLDAIEPGEGLVRIGATATLEAVRTHSIVVARLPSLAALLAFVGALGVRHLATIGGNIAWRCGDLVPVLLALDAVIETSVGEVSADAVPARALITAVRVPDQPPLAAVEKVGYRGAFSPALVTVAAFARPGGRGVTAVRVAIGGGATAPRRLLGVERRVEGGERDRAALTAVIRAEASTGDDALATAEHRRTVAARVLADHLSRWPR
jgi:CO/xanthine dehydrogenase FAD-binding subunit